MPNLDTGHYFLSLLVPIKTGARDSAEGSRESHADRIRDILTLLPTALQSAATEKIGVKSPFAESNRIHFVRMFVLDNAAFNGRTKTNAILGRIFNVDLLAPKPVDELSCPFLVISVDFDAINDAGDPLPKNLSKREQEEVRDGFSRMIWNFMPNETREIFENCVGFESVNSDEAFATYLAKCQVETTMSFNDYWASPPKLKSLSLRPYLIALALPLIAALLSVGGWIFGTAHVPLLSFLVDVPNWAGFIGGLGVTALGLWLVYRLIMARGMAPMPPSEYGDLPSVLKSLYLQQVFTDFAIENQHNDAEKLHADFGAFLDKHKPSDTTVPSQPAGVISTAAAQN